MAMIKFRNNKLELLKELQKIVSQEMSNAKMNVEFEQDVAEFLTEVVDKKRFRRLKMIRRELDSWIEEMKTLPK
jgi:hypothetical protein